MKSDKSNDDILIDMLNELNHGTDYEKYIDVEESLKYISLNAVTANMDSYLGGNKQNYYLYEDKGVFSILPWDYNMAFGGMGSADVLIDEPTQGALAERPLIAKLLANDEYKAKYHEIFSEMMNGYLADDTFQTRMDQLDIMISSYVKADPSAFYTFEQYEEGIKSVKIFMSNMAKNIQQQLDGTIPSSGDRSGSGMGGGMGGGGFGGGARNGAAPGATAAGQGAGVANAGTKSTGAGTAATNAESGQAATDEQAPQGGAGGEPGAMGGPAIPEGGNGPGGGGMGGGMPGGMGDNFGAGAGAMQQKGSTSEAITTGVAILLLLLTAVIVTFYKRKRL